jgi:hypothetical protein
MKPVISTIPTSTWNSKPEWTVPRPHDITGGVSIYNPTAPPPSTNYIPFTYGKFKQKCLKLVLICLFFVCTDDFTVGGAGNTLERGQHMRLAGSGSGSESDHKVQSTVGASSVSDGGFLAAIAARQQSNLAGEKFSSATVLCKIISLRFIFRTI